MASDPVAGHAQSRSPIKKSDDFDMVKLQKQLRHEQRRSSNSKYKATKLSPAEIRSLNYNDSAMKAATGRAGRGNPAKAVSSSTPPSTPENTSASRKSHQSKRDTTTSELQTPPISPPQERRGSNASNRIIYAPQPLSHHQLAAYSAAPLLSRPSSQHSYRGVATYRGPEITRSGSLTMLQRPSPDIVSNPLSNFSRPRQSTVTSSPEKSTAYQRQSEDSIISSVPRPSRAQTIDVVSRTTSRQHSPIRVSDSPVSMDERRHLDQAIISAPPVVEVPVAHLSSKELPQVPTDEPSEPSAKQKLNWRKTLTGSSTTDSERASLKKELRRRTFILPKAGQCLHAVNYADTKPGQPPQRRDTLRDELPSIKTSVFKADENPPRASSEFSSHPAVRPLCQDGERSSESIPDSSTSSSRKGKEREVDVDSVASTDMNSLASSSAYMRCDCCGRVVKPGGYASDLSPVLENDNIRTNLDSEIERFQSGGQRRLSSYRSNHPQYVSTLPTRVADSYQQMGVVESGRQFKPSSASSATGSIPPGSISILVNKPGDVIGPSSMPLAIMPPSKTAPRFTRFGSLHARKETSPTESGKENNGDSEKNLEPAGPQRFGSLYGHKDRYEDGEAETQTVLQTESQEMPRFRTQSPNPTQSQPQSISAYQAQQLREAPPSSAYSHSHSSYHSANASRQSIATSRSKLSQELYRENEEQVPDLPAILPQSQTMASLYAHDTTMQDHIKIPTSADVPAQALPISQPFNVPEDDNDDGPMVDLSSFDGHFVHRSLAQSTTVLETVSPPTSSHGPEQQEQIQQTSPPRPARIDTSVASDRSLDATSAYTSASIPSSTPSHSYSATYHVATTSPILKTNRESSNAKIGEFEDGQVASPRYSTTVVRLIPSPVIVSASASPISTNNKGQLKLGDWVMPESPSTANGRIGVTA